LQPLSTGLMEMNEVIVLCTTDSQELAEAIASALVEACEAACVSIVPGIRSVYRWEGKVCKETEFLMLIKTTADKFEEVRCRIRRMHSYQVPEIIAASIVAGDTDYLQWLHASVKGE
jgi:periplasmic divalent cation tolerance protein